MGPQQIEKFIFSAIALFTVFTLSSFLKFYAKKTQEKHQIKKSRYFAIKRLVSFLSIVLCAVALVFIWGIDVKNLWASMTGILAMIAVAFFAVWSLVGNILAGFIIYFTSPFKINDTIEVMPDEIRGKVLAINTFYTVLFDDEENYINVPNSLFFQKYTKKIKSKKKQT